MGLSTKVLTLLLCLFAASYATEVLLKNGKSYSGELISETGSNITLRNGKKKYTIRKTAVAKINGKPYQTVGPRQRGAVMKPLAPENSTPKKIKKKPPAKSTGPWIVTLKNGSVFRGPRISENKRILVLESKGSPVSIFKNVIASIDSGNGSAAASSGDKKSLKSITSVESPVKKIKSAHAEVEKKGPGSTPRDTSGGGDAGTVKTVVFPKPKRTAETTSINKDTAKGATEQRKPQPQTPGTSVKKTAAAEKKKHSLADMMTVDVVTADRQAVNSAVSAKPGTSSGSVSQKQQSPVLPRPKPRIKVSSINASVSPRENKLPTNTAKNAKEVHTASDSEKQLQASDKKKKSSVHKTSTVTPAPSTVKHQKAMVQQTQNVENSTQTKADERDEPFETAKMVEIPPPQKRTQPQGKPDKSVSRDKHTAVSSGSSSKKSAAVPLPSGSAKQSVSAKAAPVVPAVTVVAPLGKTDENSSPAGKTKKPGASKKGERIHSTASRTPPATATERPVLPQASEKTEKIRKKRTDGKREIVMNNGTEFIGTIISENARFIVFKSDGATVTIFKHLIMEIDGEPYTRIKKETPSRSAPKLTQGKNKPARKKRSKANIRRKQDTFRVIPGIILPDDADAGQLARQVKNGTGWKERSTAIRSIGAMGQWAVSEIDAIVPLLSDTAASRSGVPHWIDSTNEKDLLAPGLEAARALALMGSEGESALVQKVQDRNPLVRRNAVFGLGYCSSAESRKKVIESLNDPDALVRRAALGSLPPKEAFPHFKKALEDRDAGVRGGSVELLGKIRNEAMVAELLPLGKSPNAGVRAAIAQLVGVIGSDEGTSMLKELCNDADTDVRTAAVRSLGMVKDSSVVPMLIDKLGDANPGIRADAVEALGNFRDSRSIPALYAAVKDKNSVVRENAQVALRKHTEIPLLIRSLDDESELIRSNAAYILWLMTGQDNGEDKTKWEKWAAAQKSTPEK